jgi:hypothetical protein
MSSLNLHYRINESEEGNRINVRLGIEKCDAVERGVTDTENESVPLCCEAEGIMLRM